MHSPAETLRSPQAQSQAQGGLSRGLDVFRGLTILAVVLHHASGQAQDETTGGGLLSVGLAILNRSLLFVVPAFLMLSAALLTASLQKNPDLKRYFQRRVLRGVWPYVLWTALYAAWYVLRGERSGAELLQPGQWAFWLAYGKASFHLYYLLVALELYIVLPLLQPLARRKIPVWAAMLLGLGLQLLVYVLNAHWFHFRFPASSVLWYLPAVFTGVALGARLSEFPAWWHSNRWWLLAGLILSASFYLPQAVSLLRGGDVGSLSYSLGNWLYTLFASVCLLAGATALANRLPQLAAPLASLGSVSLQVYLIHPALLQVLDELGFPGDNFLFTLAFLLYTALALSLPWLVAWWLRGKRVGDVLFGR